jgi:hypothetical protein
LKYFESKLNGTILSIQPFENNKPYPTKEKVKVDFCYYIQFSSLMILLETKTTNFNNQNNLRKLDNMMMV